MCDALVATRLLTPKRTSPPCPCAQLVKSRQTMHARERWAVAQASDSDLEAHGLQILSCVVAQHPTSAAMRQQIS
jgi:hypothetical protein